MDFLTSFAVITLSSLLLGSILSKLKLPPLVAMLIVGIVLITAPLGAVAIDNLYKKLLTHDIATTHHNETTTETSVEHNATLNTTD